MLLAKATQMDLTIYLIDKPIDTFAKRADPDQAALIRAAVSMSTLFAHGNMISDPTQVDLTCIAISLFYVQA